MEQVSLSGHLYIKKIAEFPKEVIKKHAIDFTVSEVKKITGIK